MRPARPCAKARRLPRSWFPRILGGMLDAPYSPARTNLICPCSTTRRTPWNSVWSRASLSGAVMQSVSKEMFNGSSGREMLDESLARVENSPELSPEDRKALRDVLSGARELNERRAGTGPGSIIRRPNHTFPDARRSDHFGRQCGPITATRTPSEEWESNSSSSWDSMLASRC
jgi:hypothetical protein